MNRVRLPRDGRRRVFLTLRVSPPFGVGAAVEVQVEGDSAWYPCEHTVITGELVTADVLLRGPSLVADGTPDVPVPRDATVRVRLTDAPEFEYSPGFYVALAS